MNASLTSSHPFLYDIVFGLDGWLRQMHGVGEYSSHPLCIFRIQLAQLDRTVTLADGVAAQRGDRIIDLHLWNEHIPRMPPCGATPAWASKMRRCLKVSLQELAEYLSQAQELQDIIVVRGKVMFCTAATRNKIARLCTRFGFELADSEQCAGFGDEIHRLGENLLVSMMVLALNSAALRADTLRRARVDVFLSRKQLMARYGSLRPVRIDIAQPNRPQIDGRQDRQ